MSDFLSIRAINLITPTTLASVSLDGFLKRPTGVASPLTVLDSITLSAAAQTYISTTANPFQARTQGLADLAKGGVAFTTRDYSGAVFIGQDLRNATFRGSILVDANFTAANLQGAKFIDSLLTRATFTQADLRGADLSGAQDLEFAQVAGAVFDTTTTFPAGIGNAIFGTFNATGGSISSARGG